MTEARDVGQVQGNGRQPQQLRRRSPAVRRAAARMVVAANRANGETPDPKILAIAEDPAPDTI
jgi:hypothetical protein